MIQTTLLDAQANDYAVYQRRLAGRDKGLSFSSGSGILGTNHDLVHETTLCSERHEGKQTCEFYDV